MDDCGRCGCSCSDHLLGALLRIKEVIRRRVESSEEDDTDVRGMTQRLEDILKDSSGEMSSDGNARQTAH